MEMYRYHGKVAVVTGAGDTVGLCMVERLVAEGAKVVALDADPSPVNEKFLSKADSVYCLPCDVTDRETVDQALEKIIRRFGRIDVLFSNTRAGGQSYLLDTSEEEWKRTIRSNLDGTFFINQAVLRFMVDNKIKGAVVNTSSAPPPGSAIGISTQAAGRGVVAQLTKCMALEMAPYGIRVNAIGQGTKRVYSMAETDCAKDEIFSHIPMERYCEPEETAATALYLGSSDASYITGVTLMEDGGPSL